MGILLLERPGEGRGVVEETDSVGEVFSWVQSVSELTGALFFRDFKVPEPELTLLPSVLLPSSLICS